jgi:tRNA pseudouridine55 synthase
VDGAIIIDKPEGWTSHDVVAKTRRIAGQKKIGHLGTLDPIATGLLPLVLGRATRLAQFYSGSDKTYECLVRFGWSTTTYDRAGEPTSEPQTVTVDPVALEAALEMFRGEILQTPPPVSAKKVDGKRAYDLARENAPPELKPVRLHVHELVFLGMEGADVRLRARCSAGTYMRSIAHDLGKAIGCGAHLAELRRTASAEFDISQARTLDQLTELAAEGRIEEAMIPPARLLRSFPSVVIDDITASQVRNGRNFQASPFRAQPAGRLVKAVDRAGALVAIGEIVLPNLYHPVVVL